jgi:hypothetical protein
MLERLEELAAQHADFAFETTLVSRTFAPFIRKLRDAGYRVQLVYVWLNSADLCIERVRGRARARRPLRGREDRAAPLRAQPAKLLQPVSTVGRRMASVRQFRSGRI